MKDDDNIFDTASKKLNNSKDAPASSNNEPFNPQSSASSPRMPKINTQIRDMLDKMDQMKRDLDDQLEKFRRQMGMTDEQLKKYLNYTRNLNLDKWDTMKENSSKLEQRLQDILGTNYKSWEDIEKVYRAESKPPPPPPTEKERKGKTLGGRRKWMPMR